MNCTPKQQLVSFPKVRIIELFRRLNQQFNDNFKKQGYHDINDKNKE